jgi:palmitoyltransferase
VVLFIEHKFCSVCHLEMPLRTKHCKDCDHCIATHDHHCVYLNNCIGEHNARQFYCYLLIQAVQLMNGLVLAQRIGSNVKVKTSRAWFYLLTLLMIGVLLFVLALVCLHTYLMTKGLTSWEHLSWMNITYLKVWPRKYGSPFSKGSAWLNVK